MKSECQIVSCDETCRSSRNMHSQHPKKNFEFPLQIHSQ
uniref:Uncharacterized protein n=1 Tax=Anguilla anguilla TaxID=7936 RepID=A0A0E9QCF8_ANGAN